jgi:hypothetical protein
MIYPKAKERGLVWPVFVAEKVNRNAKKKRVSNFKRNSPENSLKSMLGKLTVCIQPFRSSDEFTRV